MRIISGLHKGRKITAPKKLPVRPTTDMVKESLFNILRNTHDFTNISVLDLFSGTGNISYEFASRGCNSIFSVDDNYGCVSFINKTTASLDLPIQVIKSDVFTFLEQTSIGFDIIFADPPYDLEIEKFEQIISAVCDSSLLHEGGFLIIEHSKYIDLSAFKHFEKAKRYGGSVLSFFEKVN